MNTTGRLQDLIYTDWSLNETRFNADKLHYRETVFTIGNGYLGTRGAFEEGYRRASPATLVHGVYDDVPVVYTELVNCPDWLPLVVIVDGDRFRLDRGDILSYERQLDLHRGILSRRIRWRSPGGKIIDIHLERFASLADKHVLAVRCQLTPVDCDGVSVEIQGSINGYPENQGFNHWELLDQGKNDQGVWLQVRTRSSRIELGMAAGMRITGTKATFQVASAPGYPTLTTTFQASSGETVTVEKFITVFTSREEKEPILAAQAKLTELPSYSSLIAAHEQAWEEVWDKSDILIEGDTKAQLAVRYNLFQLLSASPHDDKVSIPAKTLSGFGYRGHVFWDTEIFILPFFTYTQPETARKLLTYRYHTINGAQRKAAYDGYKGAMYAWESADTGDEVTPRWSLPHDPYGEDIRIWCRDREIHISSDIVYAIWYYWQATGDSEWMQLYGAEIILDTAVFWMSRVEWNTKQERYEIREVIGADEYHEKVDNNAFTNKMVQWHLSKAIIVYDWLSSNFPSRATELQLKLNLTSERRSRWQDIATNIWIPHDQSTGLIEQFEGFFKLEDINLEEYEPRTKSMQAILGIEGCNKRQVLKQPDVLMLLYLMRQSRESPYSPEVLQKNWDYYAPRTDITYGSSLGPAIHAILASDLGKSVEAYQRFMQAAMVDLEDVRGNAHEGIHGASAGGVWQAAIWGFGGIQLTQDGPVANPHLPPGWKRLKFKFHWRGTWHEFDLRSAAEEVGEKLTSSSSDSPTPKTYTEKHSFSTDSVTQMPSPTTHSPNILGFIFDLDGVLTDTAEYHYRAWQKLADEEGLPFDRQANEALRGVSRRESLLIIIGKRQYSEAQIQEMMDRKNRYYVESIENISSEDLLPGSLAFLAELRQAGIKIAIGSASKNAHTVVEKLGIADRVDAIADGYSVQHPKPAPDLFLFAANQLGLEPARCVVVEDAAAGIEAALAAGMWAVGLGPSERVGAAHVVLPSLADVTWTDLQAKLKC